MKLRFLHSPWPCAWSKQLSLTLCVCAFVHTCMCLYEREIVCVRESEEKWASFTCIEYQVNELFFHAGEKKEMVKLIWGASCLCTLCTSLMMYSPVSKRMRWVSESLILNVFHTKLFAARVRVWKGRRSLHLQPITMFELKRRKRQGFVFVVRVC